jgi:hypothetical protein
MRKTKVPLTSIRNPLNQHIPTSTIRIITSPIPPRSRRPRLLHSTNPSLRTIRPKSSLTIPSILLAVHCRITGNIRDDMHAGIPFALIPKRAIELKEMTELVMT